MALKRDITTNARRAYVAPVVRTQEEAPASAPLLMCTAPKVVCPGLPTSCVPDACFCDDSC